LFHRSGVWRRARKWNMTKGVWTFFIKNYRLTYLVILIVVIGGTVSFIQLPRESNPEVNIPIVVVQTIYPGASAKDTEELVTDVLEDKLLALEGVENVSSTSGEGFSSVVVEFDIKYPGNLKQEVQDRVDESRSSLPKEAENPIVEKIDTSDEPIYVFSLAGPYDVAQINQFAKELKNRIEKIPDISEVQIFGGQEREIQVIVDRASLDSFGFSISQITSAISQANADIPTGSIETGNSDYNIRLAGRLFSAQDIKKVPIGSFQNSVILVEDVAQVVDSYKRKTSLSKLSVESGFSNAAVTVQVSKSKGGNIIKSVEKIEQIIEQAESDILPDNIELVTIISMADFIETDLNQLFWGGFQTILIILPLLCLFVGIREALLACFAIPFSFLITFVFLSFFGMTLNFLSLFSLILALGILIDTAIVIIERMNLLIKQGQESSKQAAIDTILEFKWPLIVGTLTTVFAFLPMLLMSGILGEYVKHIPITVTMVLLSSLFVGLGIIPVLGERFLRKQHKVYLKFKICKKERRFVAGIFDKLIDRYRNYLSLVLGVPKKRKRFVRAVVILFFLSFLLPALGILKINMFPPEDFGYITINIEKPVGTLLQDTAKEVEIAEDILRQESQIKSFSVNVSANTASISVNLKDKKERENSSIELVDKYQEILTAALPNARVSVSQISSGPPSFAPIDIAVKGEDLAEIESIAEQFKGILKRIPGAVNVKTSAEEIKGEFVINIDRAKAELYGISTVQLAQVLRNAVQGTKAATIRSQGEEIDVVVKYDFEKTDISAIESLTIATMKGDIPLSEFTGTELSAGRSVIKHEGGLRTVRAYSSVEGETAPIEVINAFKEEIKNIDIPEDVQIDFGGEQQDIEQSYNDLFKAMIVAIFLIGTILILQFHSYRQPFFILVTIPLALIGVFPGLVLIQSPLSFPAIIGIVALAGIVVNNGIILIDKINRNRRSGMLKMQAIVDACSNRFRPVFLTTVTTILGILPISLTSSLWAGLGFTLIFGLMASATFTLFVVPILYLRFAEKTLD